MSSAAANGATDQIIIDKKARADSKAALAAAKAAGTKADQSLALAKSFATALDEHSRSSIASFASLRDEVIKTHQISLQALHATQTAAEEIQTNRTLFTTQFTELDHTVSQLKIRAAAEDNEELAEERAETIIKDQKNKIRGNRQAVFAAIGWILASAASIATVGMYFSMAHQQEHQTHDH